MSNRLKNTLLCLALAVLPTAAWAQDTDIYIGANTAANTNPNVMIVIDNSSNWSGTFSNSAVACTADNTKFCNEVLAMKTVVSGLTASINVGLTMFAETGTNGGYVRFAARPMNAANKAALLGILSGLIRNGSGSDSSGSNQPYGYTMFELFKYFGGYTHPANANNNVAGSPVSSTAFGTTAYAGGASNNSGTYRRDFAGNSRTDSAGALAGNAFSSSSSNTYVSPISDACQKNFVIFISNGNPSVGGDSGVGTINTAVGMNTTTINPPNHANTFDEWARFLYTTDVSSLTGKQNVVTYTVGVYDPQNNCTITSTNNCASNSDNTMLGLMSSAARAGGGKSYSTTNYTALQKALLDIMIEIQAVNSVFASASLPVSVNTQGTYLNQIFIGMFRPDGDAKPRWGGNLKQFKFVPEADSNVSLADSEGALAINPATGFITGCSKSFWTSDSSFWSFQPTTSCSGSNGSSDNPDGEVVEKGAAAQRLRSSTITSGSVNRTMYTWAPGDTALTAFNNANTAITQAQLGATSAAERTSIIEWMRGIDNMDEDGDLVTNEVRPYIHGDVVHSRPLAIDFGTAASANVVVFYGDNLGAFHAINGNKAVTDGNELWSFVPPECFAIPKRVRDQSPIVDFWSGANPFGYSPTPTPKNYCVDGASGVLKQSDKTWIYMSMRRGGRSIYALNVTTPTTPAFGWRLSSTSTGMSNLGYTWSTPRAAFVNGLTTPVVLFGGGYDNCEDQDAAPNTSCPARPLGADVYVVDALTGTVLKTFTSSGMRSVAADLTLLDNDNDGKVDIAYAVDTIGGVYRMNFLAGGAAAWTITKVADLSGGGRKFLYSPEVVKVSTGGVLQYVGIALASGDREHPLSSNASAGVTNRFYFIKDTLAASPTLATDALLTNLGSDGARIDPVPAINEYGWRFSFRVGEQGVTTPIVVGGIIYFSTNRAVGVVPGSCSSNLGEARGYAVYFKDGLGALDNNLASTTFVGGGLPPSPVVATVKLDNGVTQTVCIGCAQNSSPLGASEPPINVPKVRKRVWWYEAVD